MKMERAMFHALRAIEVPEIKVEAVIQALETDMLTLVATKSDLSDLEHRLTAEISQTDRRLTTEISKATAEIAETKHGLTAEIAKIKYGLTSDIAEIKHGMNAQFAKSELKLTLRMAGMLIATVSLVCTILIGAMKYFF